jgi:hypothetical protein
MPKLFSDCRLRAVRRIALSGSIATGSLIAQAGLGLTGFLAPGVGMAYAEDVVLQNVKIDGKEGSTLIPRVEVKGSNLGQSDIAKLFQAGSNPGEAATLFVKFKAASVHIPEVQLTSKDGFSGTLHEFMATDINEGKLGKLTIAGFDGSGTDPNGPVNVKIGPLTAEGANFDQLINPSLSGKQIAADQMTGAIDHMLLKDVELSLPDSSTPASAPGGNLIRIKIPTAEAARDKAVTPQQKGTFEIKSILVELPKSSQGAQTLSAFGYDNLDLGLKSAVTYDFAAKTISIDEVTISGVKAGALTVKAQLGNIPRAEPGADPQMQLAKLMTGNVSSLQLSLSNSGIFEKSLAVAAKQQNTTPDALKAQISVMAGAVLPSLLQGDPAGKTIGDAISKFVADPKNITIGMKAKGDPIPFGELQMVHSPSDILSKVTVTATANQ